MIEDEWNNGFGAAMFLGGSPTTREMLLARDATTWTPSYLAGFLEAHETLVRNQVCTCHCCPLHGEPHGLAARAGSN